ncbi:Splicing factor 3B subunit 2 [Bulinus truncatus]|nr:Splicing factor 3B subunit 2 [Bulinus truncatus]
MMSANQGHHMAPAGMPPAGQIRGPSLVPNMPQRGPSHPGQMGQPPMLSGMMQGGPPPMPPGGGPPMMQGGPPMLPGGGPMQMMPGGPPQIPQGGGPPSMLSGGLPPGGGPQHLMHGGPPMHPGGQQMMVGPPPLPPIMQGGLPSMGMDAQVPLQDMGDRQSMYQQPHDNMGHIPSSEGGDRQSMYQQPHDNMGHIPSSEGDEEPGSPSDDQQTDFNGPASSTPSANQGSKEMRLPQALEKMLEFKSLRATELGVDLDNMDNKEEEKENFDENESDEDDDDYDDKDRRIEDMKEKFKESKNKRRKKKKKKARKNRFEQQKKMKKKEKKSKAPDVQIEYVQEQLELDPSDPSYHTFAKIFEAFKITEVDKPKDIKLEDKVEEKKEEIPIKAKGLIMDDEDEEEITKTEEDGPKISKKKLKKLTRLTVAQLKQLVSRPDVVEMHDVTARDPRLLVHLKAARNSVPVPRHWCYKRKYLQGKRGIEKPPFELPDFIKATGIEEMRAALQEKEDQKTLKSKMREKVRPKMGKIDIDYQKLHDAFFRFQTKPKMTLHGDLYYEAKEFETKLREKKPGNLSDDLKLALGMPIGNNSEKVPPPWLIAMQRYGPPPSYPNLKIPGLNAPIPDGCMFGYHAGGWGKPPVDEHGKPLYGDVFGTQSSEFKNEVEEEEIDKTFWGELESESESEEESEEEEEEEKDETGLITPADGLMTPGGITSVPLGMETPDQIELRKKRIEDAMDQGGDTPALYQILPEKKTSVGANLMGSAHVYDIAAVQKKPGDKAGAEAVEVTLNPEELDLDTAAMQAKYEQTVREQQSQLEKEDLSDMVAAHAAKQRKRKKAQQDTGKGAKKYKDFKF